MSSTELHIGIFDDGMKISYNVSNCCLVLYGFDCTVCIAAQPIASVIIVRSNGCNILYITACSYPTNNQLFPLADW